MEVKLAYMKMRKDLINHHNDRVRNEVEEESDDVREMTKGRSVIQCRECGSDVHWGNIRVHRRGGQGGCINSRLNEQIF